MATLSSHTLNSVDGSHAAGISIIVCELVPGDKNREILNTQTDAGGRMIAEIPAGLLNTDAVYEMVLNTGDYFTILNQAMSDRQTVDQIVFRFSMPDPNGKYHIPFMLSPHNYSVWWAN